jgi:7-keto-8-aminopelargonate synthetase-like enzyme
MRQKLGVPDRALQGSLKDFRVQKERNLVERCEPFFEWQDLRRQSGTWPYSRSTEVGPSPNCAIRDDRNIRVEGVNFASQDYLSLSSHPAVAAAAKAAVDRMGVHSAGSSALLGNTSTSIELERRLAKFVAMREAVLFPTGWAAGFGVIKGLVRPHDYVVMDELAHACLLVGAQSSTRHLVPFRHLNVDDARRKVARIRRSNPDAGILIVTESLFSMDSDTPDIAAMQTLAREYDATLLVDVAHDLGNLGPGGTGHIGAQGMLGDVDLVIGSFSKTFASNGGFIGTNSRALREYLQYYSPSCTFSNALSPVQAAAVTAALDIVESDEGDQLRGRLMNNVLTLREQVRERGMEVYGDPSAIVAVKAGDEAFGRLTARELPALGLLANLVEYPAVDRGQARFRLQVMAGHSADDVKAAAELLHVGTRLAADELGNVASTAPLHLARVG